MGTHTQTNTNIAIQCNASSISIEHYANEGYFNYNGVSHVHILYSYMVYVLIRFTNILFFNRVSKKTHTPSIRIYFDYVRKDQNTTIPFYSQFDHGKHFPVFVIHYLKLHFGLITHTFTISY